MDHRGQGRSICAETGKRRYADWFEARDAAELIKHEMAEDHGRPYHCEHCGGFHLGRDQGAQRAP
ncbi:MAG TPA: hypothetical protein VHJ82_09040 [Actinomycetota bacterium]|nr:hypothetical protein [Actinomycetota bacterium]